MRTALVALSFIAIHGGAFAEEAYSSGVHGSVYALPMIAPDYTGSADYRVNPFAGLHLQKGDFFLRSEGSGLVANASPFAHVVAGPAVNYRIGRRPKDIDNIAVSALGKIDGAWEIGGFAGLRFLDVLKPGDSLEMTGKALFDVSGVHEGMSVQPSLSYAAPLTDKLMLTTTLAATYGDDDSQQRYFGVTAEGAALSGLAPYEAKSGFNEAGVVLAARYALTGRWGLLGLAGYGKILGDAQDSPLVADEGDSNQFYGGLGIAFSF